MPLESTLSGIFAFRVHFGRTSGALRAYLGRIADAFLHSNALWARNMRTCALGMQKVHI